MKKTNYLVLLVLFTGLLNFNLLKGQTNITPVRTDVSGFTDWTDNEVTGTTYVTLLKATSYTITPDMNFNNYTDETLNFKARTYGGVNATENEVFVAVSTDNGANWTDIGSRTPLNTTLTAMTAFDLSSYSGTQVKIKFYVKGTNNTVGAGIDDITITGNLIASGPDNPSGFTAVANGVDQIDLSWALNPAADNVLLAWSADGTFGTPSGDASSYGINDEIDGGGFVLYYGDNTTYSHTSLDAATTYYYKMWSYDGDYSTGVTSNATTNAVADPEPSNHVADFAMALSGKDIVITWTDEATAAGYLIKMSDVGFGSITDPVDGTTEADGANTKNIAQATETYTWTGLDYATTYYFKIYPYSNSGTNIDYKTDGSVPQDSETTPVAPTLLFSETMGNAAGTTTISAHNDWDNASPVAFSGTADVRITGVSDYLGASGQANIFFTNTIGRYLLIEGIDVRGYENISLTLGHFKSTTASNNELTIEVSSDGNNWTALTYSRATGAGTANWTVIEPSGSIPSNVENLRLRFTQTSATPQFRIDDIKISGYLITDATYNTVTIEGTNSGWNSGEIFPNVTNADNVHFTWDENYLYFAISGAEADWGNLATFLFFNSAPDYPDAGTENVYAWTENIKAPFKATSVLVWRNNPDYMEFMNWDGSNWVNPLGGGYNGNNYSNQVHFEIGTGYREIRIARAVLGVENPGDKIKIASFTEQQWGNNYRYFGWPSQGWTDADRAANQTMTHCYSYTLDEFIYPNSSEYLKKDLLVTSSTTISSNETYSSVTVAAGGEFTLDDTYILNVDGDFTIISNASGTGSFIDYGTLNIGGVARAQKYLANSTSTGWYLSSPVQNPANATLSTDADGVYYFDAQNASWEEAVSWLETMTGYVARYQTFGTKTVNFTSNVFHTGTQSRTNFVRTGVGSGNYGWNLTGNPYPSAIDWDLVVGANNQSFIDNNYLNATYYVRKSDGSVADYNANTGGTGNNGATNIIPAMQAFWVHVNENYTTNGQLILNNTHRLHGNNNLYKSLPAGMLKVRVERDSYSDESTIRFVDNATNTFDGAFDGIKMFSENIEHPQVYSLDIQNEALSINSLPLLTTNTSVALGFNTKVDGQFDFIFDGVQSFDNSVNIHLEDVEANIITDLKLQNNYTFNSSIAETDSRFILHFSLNTTDICKELSMADISVFSSNQSIYINNISDDNASIKIFNLLGQEVHASQLKNQSLNKVNVNLTTGQYIVKIINNNSMTTEKVFIK